MRSSCPYGSSCLVKPMSDLQQLSGDFGECSCDGRTSLWLPAPELRAHSLFTLIEERSDRLRVRDREGELHLVPTQGVDLGDSASATLLNSKVARCTAIPVLMGDCGDLSSARKGRQAAAELPNLRAMAAVDIHNLVLQLGGDVRVIPATVKRLDG
jgi:hypothetical protein